MGENSAISWTDHTFNAWWGCQHSVADDPAVTSQADFGPIETSPECDNCYAESTDHRYGGSHWGPGSTRRFFGEEYWAKPLKWNADAERAGKRARVFCSSMADWAELVADPGLRVRMDRERDRLFALILATPWLDWLLLTKRAENLHLLVPWVLTGTKPWPNVWLGVTAGVRRSLWRVRYLRQIPAVVRFISGEPLLEHITAREWDRALFTSGSPLPRAEDAPGPIHWLIVGDESGSKRHAQADWIRTAREAALRNGVAFHFKQWAGPDVAGIGGVRKGPGGKIHLPLIDGRRWAQIPGVS